MKERPARSPKGKLSQILASLLVTVVVGFIYFYVSLPALNFQDPDFYTFLFLLCVVYVVASVLISGFRAASGASGVKEYLHFIKSQCLPVGILMVLLVLVGVVGSVISMPIFRASAYRDLLDVQDGDFATDIAQISFNEIPTLDRDSANYLGDRQMGTLSDMVSQFEYSGDSTQINYHGRPVRVAPIAYADLIKWFTNRGGGLPAYVLVDMVSQEATVVRLPEGEGMKYSFSEPLNRNIMRHLRFHYPTYMFDTPQFEINEEGTPYWIAPRIVKTIGLLFAGNIIHFISVFLAITGVVPRVLAFFLANVVQEFRIEDLPQQIIGHAFAFAFNIIHRGINGRIIFNELFILGSNLPFRATFRLAFTVRILNLMEVQGVRRGIEDAIRSLAGRVGRSDVGVRKLAVGSTVKAKFEVLAGFGGAGLT